VPHLTAIDPELDRLVKQTLPGMAHWAGTGPADTTCGGCKHYGYASVVRDAQGNVLHTVHKEKRCGRYWELMHRHGAELPPSTPSCRQYETK
jgi:hypothetical protein